MKTNKLCYETHRIATINTPDSVKLYIGPLVERIHRISPNTKMTYEFDCEPASSAVLVRLGVGQQNFTAEEIIKNRSLLERSSNIIEMYISANRGSDGCVACGAVPKQQCATTCPVLDAELCLASLTSVLGEDNDAA